MSPRCTINLSIDNEPCKVEIFHNHVTISTIMNEPIISPELEQKILDSFREFAIQTRMLMLHELSEGFHV